MAAASACADIGALAALELRDIDGGSARAGIGGVPTEPLVEGVPYIDPRRGGGGGGAFFPIDAAADETLILDTDGELVAAFVL
jgi:hypothetical protein